MPVGVRFACLICETGHEKYYFRRDADGLTDEDFLEP
jgi:hypothetical protein